MSELQRASEAFAVAQVAPQRLVKQWLFRPTDLPTAQRGKRGGRLSAKSRMAYAILQDRAEDLANRLLKFALGEPGQVCETCGRGPISEEIALKASLAAMDRIGMGPTARLEIDVDGASWIRDLTDDELTQLRDLRDRALERRRSREDDVA